MQKTISGSLATRPADPAQEWLPVSHIAKVEVTSENPDHPIESVFDPAVGAGWRASEPGRQAIRITFEAPLNIRRIQLAFSETVAERTQEFVLAWSPDGDQFQEILRQQWAFSPHGSTRQFEDYAVDLKMVRSLQLEIRPDLNPESKPLASLDEWRFA